MPQGLRSISEIKKMKSLHRTFRFEEARVAKISAVWEEEGTPSPARRKELSIESDEHGEIDTEFLKEFDFVNNAKKVTFLYKEGEDGNCENELMKFEENEQRIGQLYNELKNSREINFQTGSAMSGKYIELLSMNYYDLEMHKCFRGLVPLVKDAWAELKYGTNFMDLINNPKLFFCFMAFTFEGFKSTLFAMEKVKKQFQSIVFVEQRAILEHARDADLFS